MESKEREAAKLIVMGSPLVLDRVTPGCLLMSPHVIAVKTLKTFTYKTFPEVELSAHERLSGAAPGGPRWAIYIISGPRNFAVVFSLTPASKLAENAREGLRMVSFSVP